MKQERPLLPALPRLLGRPIGALLIAALSLASPACQKSRYFSDNTASAGRSSSTDLATASGTGTGSGVEGLVIYIHDDSLHPCTEPSTDGKPLPNSEIAIS